ncbi:DUF1517 domain-containing protein [Kamptonema sp. UHCC 0994]|uniref:DUF1517 domain-containing protein n=1 Tax=Kamptonema sp. UHCC 0994 TaxID=3031329 RepID=UPI0023BAA78B|nr:DUF1517 domain-containing protein [Kamptonema sp. UHCC 0994]MDF0556059.1 DUF1517 domain-containing protein [Kamptonema sp. UHCC 0994]
MNSWRDRFNQMTGQTRLVVCRLFVHLEGEEVAPLLGVLNRTARQAIDAEGDLEILGQGLVEICTQLLQYDTYWRSAANEGDVFYDESQAADYVDELFTDSAQRYLSEPDFSGYNQGKDATLSLPVTKNLIAIITVAYEGEIPTLENDLASMTALKNGLKALINLHYQEKLRAIQVHFSPAQFGDELTDDQVLMNFPELIPL